MLCVGNMFAEKDQRTDVVPSWDIFDEDETYGNMYRWRSHAAFTQINEVVVMGDKAYGLSSNSLFKHTSLIEAAPSISLVISAPLTAIGSNPTAVSTE